MAALDAVQDRHGPMPLLGPWLDGLAWLVAGWLATWAHDPIGPWVHGPMGPWPPMGSWRMGPRAHGPWAHGPMGP